MKKMKKLFALLLTFAMVMGMTVTAMADGGNPPSAKDTAPVTISNLEAGATVDLYRVVKPTYNDLGFTGYELAKGISFADKYQPTSDEITALANQKATLLDTLGSTEKVTGTVESGTSFTRELGAGTWLVLVTPPQTDTAKVYNPMIVSVYYKTDQAGQDTELSTPTEGVNANENWSLEGDDAYAKSSTVPFEKELENPKLDTKVQVNDVIGYKITSRIPAYAEEYYPDAQFNITDEIINGLEYVQDEDGTPGVKLNVTVGGSPVEEGADKAYTLTTEEGKFIVSFNKAYIWSLADETEPENREVVITYKAKVTDDAVKYIGENKATLDYSTKPGTGDDSKGKKEDKKYVFTFALHGMFYKKDEANQPLNDATFTLYKEDETSEATIAWSQSQNIKVSEVANYTTGTDGTDGEIKFKGLDGESVYYLRETAAPDTYSLNDTIYRIAITTDPEDLEGTYNGDTVVLNPEPITYTVTVTNNKDNTTNSYEVEYLPVEKGTVVDDSYGNIATVVIGSSLTNIPNTKLSNLPSTGGIGTTIFTVGGCAIMIIAAALFFASRKKSQK